MARDFIPINLTTSLGPNLKQAIALQRQAYAQLIAIRDAMTHMEDGTNFDDIEKQFGVPVGNGQKIFDLINGSIGAMEGTFQNNNIKIIIEQVG